MMAAQTATVGFNTGAKGVGFSKTRTPEEPPTLAEAGIDKNLAHRARTLARLSAKEFEEAVKENRARIADERADGGAQSMSRRGNRQKADRR